MKRTGDQVFLWMVTTGAMMVWLDPPVWTVVLAAFIVGWYYNDREERAHAS